MTYEWLLLILGVLAIVALWDAAKRAIAAQTANHTLEERLRAAERELEALKAVQQNLLSKLNAAQAAQSTRGVPRLAR